MRWIVSPGLISISCSRVMTTTTGTPSKRKYENVFIRHLNDAFGSSEETRGWIDFALDCQYINSQEHKELDDSYDEVNAMLFSLMNNWKSF